jgi:tetratricopeptide (TPR) repeat protein
MILASQPLRLSRDRLVALAVCIPLAALTVLVYRPTFHHAFVNYDDQTYVYQNRHVQEGLSAAGVRWAFTTFECDNWHPLTWLSLQLDATLYGGMNAGGFHVTNVILHVANTLLLFGVLAGMTGAVWRSAVVAALFALHPLHVESVAWVSERKDVLSTLFGMLTLAAYLGYVRRPGVGRYLLVVLALALSLMSKPMLVTLPCVLLLLDYWPLRRWRPGPVAAPEPGTPAVPLGRLVLEKVPLFALVLASCAVTCFAQTKALAPITMFPLGVRVANALLAYVEYLGKMLWPLHLAVYYPHPGSEVSAVQAVGAGLFLAVVTLLVLVPGRRWPYLAVGWLWYLGTLVPVIGLVQVGNQALADRYTYVPLIGIFLALTWGVCDLARACRLPRLVVAAAATAVLAGCAVRTWDQVGYWKSSWHLWDHAARVTGENVTVHLNLGVYYYQLGLIADAESEFRAAVALAPENAIPHVNLGNVLEAQGRREQAMEEFRLAIALNPNYAAPRFNLGNLLAAQGRYEEALAELRRAIALEAGMAWSHDYLARLLLLHGLTEEALAECREALALEPDYASAHFTLGSVLAALGRSEEAASAFQTTIALDPKGGRPHTSLGKLLLADGRLKEALAEYRRAVELGDAQAEPLVRACERLEALRPRLDALAARRDWPGDAAEGLAFAEVCRQTCECRYALSARMYAEAFESNPELAADVEAANRFNAARAAAAAGCGQGRDGANRGDAEKTRLRRQALDWLRADLAVWSDRARGETPKARSAVRQALEPWRRTADLAGVRDPVGLEQLPEDEGRAWQALWHEVDAVLARVSGQHQFAVR